MQIRGSLFVLAFPLAIVMPAGAADPVASKPISNPAVMKALPATSTAKLPEPGTKLPGSTKPIGGIGAPGSLNMSDKATPLGPPVVGGKTVGGPKSLPGAGGSTTPTSGNTLVNPLQNKGGGATASIDQFTKEAKLKPLTSAGQDVLNQAGAKAAPGRQSGDSLLGATNPDFAAGRGKDVSKQDQQSMSAGGMSDAARGSAYLPGQSGAQSGGAAPVAYPANAAADTQDKADAVKPSSPKEATASAQGDEAGAARGTASNTFKASNDLTAKFTVLVGNEAKVTDIGPTTGGTPGKAVAPSAARVVILSGRPAPEGPGAAENDIGGAKVKDNKPTVNQAVAAKKRQAGMPVEGKQEIERMKGNQRAAADTMARKRANAINPGSEASTVGAVHSTGGAKPTGNSPEGGPSGTAGGRPGGCPADSPSC
jgi:hypothetical protein